MVDRDWRRTSEQAGKALADFSKIISKKNYIRRTDCHVAQNVKLTLKNVDARKEEVMKIEIPKTMYNGPGNTVVINRHHWYDLINAIEDHNKMLAEGVEVYRHPNLGTHWDTGLYANASKEKALLINIQPIKKDTTEDVLRDFVNQYKTSQDMASVYQRAKAVLD